MDRVSYHWRTAKSTKQDSADVSSATVVVSSRVGTCPRSPQRVPVSIAIPAAATWRLTYQYTSIIACSLLLFATPLFAQPSPEDIVQRHRESYGERITPTEAPILLRAIAVDLTQTFGTRYGLLVKQSGNNCGGVACDIICDANHDHWDVFTDGPDANEHYAGLAAPSWIPKGSLTSDRTCSLVEAPVSPQPDPIVTPPVDLTPLEHAIDALTTRIAEVEAQLASVMHDVTSVRGDLETRTEGLASAVVALAARPTITTCHASAFGIPIHCEVK